jgi:hypothetical protein
VSECKKRNLAEINSSKTLDRRL